MKLNRLLQDMTLPLLLIVLGSGCAHNISPEEQREIEARRTADEFRERFMALQREAALKHYEAGVGEVQIVDLPDSNASPSLAYVWSREPNAFGNMEENSFIQHFAWKLDGAGVTAAENLPTNMQRMKFPPGWMRLELWYSDKRIVHYENAKEISMSRALANHISLKDFEETIPKPHGDH